MPEDHIRALTARHLIKPTSFRRLSAWQPNLGRGSTYRRGNSVQTTGTTSVERLWRSVKYEEVYLRAYDSVGDARASIGRYLNFYNARRPHSSLDGTTPDQAYFVPPPIRMAA